MKFITGFEDSFLPQGSTGVSKDFDQVFEALKHDISVAETAFTRGAKRELKRHLDELKAGYSMKDSSECRGLLPFWFVEATVSLPSSGPAATGSLLLDLTSGLFQYLEGRVKDHHLILIDPLHAKIVALGKDPDTENHMYQFRLKQKWSTAMVKEPAP